MAKGDETPIQPEFACPMTRFRADAEPCCHPVINRTEMYDCISVNERERNSFSLSNNTTQHLFMHPREFESQEGARSFEEIKKINCALRPLRHGDK